VGIARRIGLVGAKFVEVVVGAGVLVGRDFSITAAPLTVDTLPGKGASLPGRAVAPCAMASREAQAAKLAPAAPVARCCMKARRCWYTRWGVISLAWG